MNDWKTEFSFCEIFTEPFVLLVLLRKPRPPRQCSVKGCTSQYGTYCIRLQVQVIICDLKDNAYQIDQWNICPVCEAVKVVRTHSRPPKHVSTSGPSTNSLSGRDDVAAIRRIAIRKRPPVSVGHHKERVSLCSWRGLCINDQRGRPALKTTYYC